MTYPSCLQGIYFADMFDKSVHYCHNWYHPGTTEKHKYMLICEVGNTCNEVSVNNMPTREWVPGVWNPSHPSWNLKKKICSNKRDDTFLYHTLVFSWPPPFLNSGIQPFWPLLGMGELTHTVGIYKRANIPS